ncbi:hypothetical protein NBO_603g0001 [Nosema bombycis CQ1]|uniref:Uncharacterized protein n=1 Tax=Nosema bombycis (strain CQ1 / CVCC 102059) TaxID=578461 RepID=R0KMW0_NOSB1|nr:hypothetical protein NBO_603g0001 [Nosema bombycis CQ1]|eukprot:EOB11986.1 hypothetical protein NBO_603g0001 [Nosema bombycis CQ1]
MTNISLNFIPFTSNFRKYSYLYISCHVLIFNIIETVYYGLIFFKKNCRE